MQPESIQLASVEAIKKAVAYVGGNKLSTYSFYVEAKVSLSIKKKIIRTPGDHHVRFIFDPNRPKLFIDVFSEFDFHTEFSTQWQTFEFNGEGGRLIIRGSDKQKKQYKLTVYLDGVKAERGA